MTDPVAALREALRDRYAFERELGRGGMATVYLAQRPPARPAGRAQGAPPRARRHARPRAVPARDPARRPAPAPPHPHGARLAARPPGQLWFTMPYVEGESLRDRLRRERQLPVDDALRIATEAAQALEYAHQQGVIHRDIKPENILLTRDGNTLVADFGIARALEGGGDERLTETGLAVGTPAYMSPEQAAGDTRRRRADRRLLARPPCSTRCWRASRPTPAPPRRRSSRSGSPSRCRACGRCGRRCPRGGPGDPARARAGAGGPVRDGGGSSRRRCRRRYGGRTGSGAHARPRTPSLPGHHTARRHRPPRRRRIPIAALDARARPAHRPRRALRLAPAATETAPRPRPAAGSPCFPSEPGRQLGTPTSPTGSPTRCGASSPRFPACR